MLTYGTETPHNYVTRENVDENSWYEVPYKLRDKTVTGIAETRSERLCKNTEKNEYPIPVHIQASTCDISGSHGDEYENYSVVGYSAM
jgi:hypothetical protein